MADLRGAGGIFELTGRELGYAAEQTYSWGEEMVRTIADAINSLLGDSFKNVSEALATISEPPQLTKAASRSSGKKQEKRGRR